MDEGVRKRGILRIMSIFFTEQMQIKEDMRDYSTTGIRLIGYLF